MHHDAKVNNRNCNKMWQVISVPSQKQIGPDGGSMGHRNLLATSFVSLDNGEIYRKQNMYFFVSFNKTE